jgi:hypothetical protein
MSENNKFSNAPQVAVSVIIPTWNRKELLQQTIESFWKQTAFAHAPWSSEIRYGF